MDDRVDKDSLNKEDDGVLVLGVTYNQPKTLGASFLQPVGRFRQVHLRACHHRTPRLGEPILESQCDRLGNSVLWYYRTRCFHPVILLLTFFSCYCCERMNCEK